jgi:hypothetical protein
VDDVAVAVTAANPASSVNQGLAQGRFLLIDVSLANRSGAEVAYSPRSWSLVAADGSSIGAYPTADPGRLEFGTLAPGTAVEGSVGFDLGTTEGMAEVQYRATPADPVAAMWSVTL